MIQLVSYNRWPLLTGGAQYIQAGKELLQKGLLTQIGDGKSTSVFTHQWLPTLPLRCIQNNNLDPSLKVCDLMVQSREFGTSPKLTLCLHNMMQIWFNKVRNSRYASCHRFIWPHTKNGRNYTVKSGYWVATHLIPDEEKAGTPSWWFCSQITDLETEALSKNSTLSTAGCVRDFTNYTETINTWTAHGCNLSKILYCWRKVECGNGAHDGINKGDGDDDIDGGYNNKGETVLLLVVKDGVGMLLWSGGDCGAGEAEPETATACDRELMFLWNGRWWCYHRWWRMVPVIQNRKSPSAVTDNVIGSMSVNVI